MEAARESKDKIFHGLLEVARLGLQVHQSAILPHMGILSHMGSMFRISTKKRKSIKVILSVNLPASKSLTPRRDNPGKGKNNPR